MHGRAHGRNGTRFSVQDHFILLAEGRGNFGMPSLQSHPQDKKSSQAIEFPFKEPAEPGGPSQDSRADESTQ
jgi:hypothetical protein